MYNWSPENTALLGSMPDLTLGKKLGISRAVVCKHRNNLGIKAFRSHKIWTAKEVSLLGSIKDSVLAEKFGIKESAVRWKRSKLGIKYRIIISRPRAPREVWTAKDHGLLGSMSDSDLAEKLGIDRALVEQRRVRFGTKDYSATRDVWVKSV